ncbi:MAG: DUF2189 domain-containing protein [Caulobacteraceae bacterium]|nr:DUF2189 domain-containing protein [Caulobacteraceae bacterium]
MPPNHIRNPFEMALEQMTVAASDAGHAVAHPHHPADTPLAIRKVGFADLKDALRQGARDLVAAREDVVFVALVYSLAGLVLAELLLNHNLLPLIFPLASGFALVGPAAAVGLYEISRRREQGAAVTWTDAFGVFRSPALGSIFELGLILLAVLLAWLGAAYGIYLATLGPAAPASLSAFVHDVFATAQGWTMIVIGMGVGFLFAVVALAISVVSFPLLLDRDVGVGRAIAVSVRAVVANWRTMAVWGLIVAGALALGSLPALFGLIFVMPMLGHATWRLYRRMIVATPERA